MKAVLALVVIYVGTFLVAIQGASQNSQAAQASGIAQESAAKAKSIDPAKEADIRSLMELVGARDLVQDAVSNSTEQYREHLLATVPKNDEGQAFVNAFAESYQKKFDVDEFTSQLVSVYDQHFTDDEIKALLQFYGSPLGQKVATEMPKINREIQSQSRTASAQAAKEALQALKAQSPEVGQSARLFLNAGQAQRRFQRNAQFPSQTQPPIKSAQSQPDPQQP